MNESSWECTVIKWDRLVNGVCEVTMCNKTLSCFQLHGNNGFQSLGFLKFEWACITTSYADEVSYPWILLLLPNMVHDMMHYSRCEVSEVSKVKTLEKKLCHQVGYINCLFHPIAGTKYIVWIFWNCLHLAKEMKILRINNTLCNVYW